MEMMTNTMVVEYVVWNGSNEQWNGWTPRTNEEHDEQVINNQEQSEQKIVNSTMIHELHIDEINLFIDELENNKENNNLDSRIAPSCKNKIDWTAPIHELQGVILS